MTETSSVETLAWVGDIDGHLKLIDQTQLPGRLVLVECHDVKSVGEAIRTLRVRGAPAIGIAAAYGLCLGLRIGTGCDSESFDRRLEEVAEYLAGTRPTAVNLAWALGRMKRVARASSGQPAAWIRQRLLEEARAIHQEDRQRCRAIGRHGAPLLAGTTGVLTHCNTGGLATSEYGTALAVILTAHQQGRGLHVFVNETRPLLQGARLTTWELDQHGVPATLICDSAAAQVMREGSVQCVLVGADRIAASGDTANKIGTYALAVLAHAHNIPFYVAAPTSTFDLQLADGSQIPIEQRPAREVTHIREHAVAPETVTVYNPAFDVTPAQLINAIITELGVIRPVTADRIREVLGKS